MSRRIPGNFEILSGLDEPFASFRAVGVGLRGVARGHRVDSSENENVLVGVG